MHYSKICLRHQLQGVRPKFFFYNCIKKITCHWSVPLHIQPLPYWQSFTSSYLGSLSRFHLTRNDDGRFFLFHSFSFGKTKMKAATKMRYNDDSLSSKSPIAPLPRLLLLLLHAKTLRLPLQLPLPQNGTPWLWHNPTIRWDLSLDDVCWQPTYLPILVVLMHNFFCSNCYGLFEVGHFWPLF